MVIAVDALASRRMERVNTTIQITDTGINPGSGVGNKRKALNQDTLGIPVIAISIPTVVDATTLANDTIDLMLDAMIKEAKQGREFYNMLKESTGMKTYAYPSSITSVCGRSNGYTKGGGFNH